MHIPVVDIFAGPGGLGEGFSAFSPRHRSSQRPFRITISAEMEKNAAKTLRLRAFFRQFAPGHVPKSYYEYVAGRAETPWTAATEAEWLLAGDEARQLTLGEPEHDSFLHARIKKTTQKDQPWVLIGGPPCQAYSLVGRARNLGVKGYSAEKDHRHFLYTHYLRILRDHQPAAFVMENVKGILSSKVDGELMFPRILDDLHQPGGRSGPRYRIVPLMLPRTDAKLGAGGSKFVLHAEELGVPQARHRVVLLGISEELDAKKGKLLVPDDTRYCVSDAISGLPPLRSGVTDFEVDCWWIFARDLLEVARSCAYDDKVSMFLGRLTRNVHKRDPGMGGRWTVKTDTSDAVPDHLRSWLTDRRLDGILNHEVREHMTSDLVRYAFASAFAKVHDYSPRGPDEFPAALYPEHKNWMSGKFVDRFKVQISGFPSSTITSHLSKDGHYFIHPEPGQLRSLSVREAARLQTFPDNYFFEGSRGAQFKQVGNAVPPWMAKHIAGVVYSFLGS